MQFKSSSNILNTQMPTESLTVSLSPEPHHSTSALGTAVSSLLSVSCSSLPICSFVSCYVSSAKSFPLVSSQAMCSSFYACGEGFSHQLGTSTDGTSAFLSNSDYNLALSKEKSLSV